MPPPAEYLRTFSAVVVTGGSSGIGRAFIGHIRNLNREVRICNLSRRRPVDVEELKVRHFPCDLSKPGEIETVAANLKAELAAAPPGKLLLINNSGFGSYGVFPLPDLAHHLEMLDVNVRAVVHLTGMLLPVLLARGGVVMNIASTAAFQPTPWMATYGASKAFLLHWSLALHEDLRGSGVGVMAVCPGRTETEFFQRAGLTKVSPAKSPRQPVDEVVEESLQALASGRVQVVTGWPNKLSAIAGSLLPKPITARIAKKMIARYRMGRDASPEIVSKP